MTPSETVMLTRYVAACCPQQVMDDYTPDAWHDLLGDLSLDDCRAAVIAIKRHSVFVDPSAIRAEVKRIRRDRIDHAIPAAPPAELADDPGRYRAELKARIRQIADGRSLNRAIEGPPAKGEPPAEFTEGRTGFGEALERPGSVSPQEIARRQAAESRTARTEHEDPPAKDPAA